MIRNRWYPIIESTQVGTRKPVGIMRLGERLVLWRGDDGKVVCMPDRCPHRSAMLSPGKIRNGCIECPYHGLRFNPQGRCVLIPANGERAQVPRGFDIAPAQIREAHGLVWYWHGEAQAAAPIPWLDEMLEPGGNTFSYRYEAPMAPMRLMENLFDFHHFNFVHRYSLPGLGARVAGMSATQNGDEILLKGTLCHERSGALKKDTPFRLRFKLPCLAAIDLGGNDVTYALVPIDDERTWVFGRYSHRILPPALGGRFISYLFARLDRWVFVHQDRPVLRSQTDPIGDISQFKLYEADRAIGLYFGMLKRATLEESGSNITAAAGR